MLYGIVITTVITDMSANHLSIYFTFKSDIRLHLCKALSGSALIPAEGIIPTVSAGCYCSSLWTEDEHGRKICILHFRPFSGRTSGLMWQGSGSRGAARMVSVSRAQQLHHVREEPAPDCLKRDMPLAKAELWVTLVVPLGKWVWERRKKMV